MFQFINWKYGFDSSSLRGYSIEQEKVGAGIANDRLAECSNFTLELVKINRHRYKFIWWQEQKKVEKKKSNDTNPWNFDWGDTRKETKHIWSCYGMPCHAMAWFHFITSGQKNPDLFTTTFPIPDFFPNSMVFWFAKECENEFSKIISFAGRSKIRLIF